MYKYCKVVNEDNGLCEVAMFDDPVYAMGIGMEPKDVEQSEVDNQWYLSDKCPHYTKEELDKQEQERISHLKCTKRVLALCLEKYGITYQQLKETISTDDRATLEWELCVELERNNELLDIMGSKLNITPQQIDMIFKYANGEVTTL